ALRVAWPRWQAVARQKTHVSIQTGTVERIIAILVTSSFLHVLSTASHSQRDQGRARRSGIDIDPVNARVVVRAVEQIVEIERELVAHPVVAVMRIENGRIHSRISGKNEAVENISEPLAGRLQPGAESEAANPRAVEFIGRPDIAAVPRRV